MPPISIEDLIIDDNIKPPTIRKQASRPCTKRIRKGAWKKKQTRCSNCLDWGHNKRSCRGQPVPSGRRERARDWQGEVVDGIREEEEESSEESSDNDDAIEVELDDEVGFREEEEDSDLSEVESA